MNEGVSTDETPWWKCKWMIFKKYIQINVISSWQFLHHCRNITHNDMTLQIIQVTAWTLICRYIPATWASGCWEGPAATSTPNPGAGVFFFWCLRSDGTACCSPLPSSFEEVFLPSFPPVACSSFSPPGFFPKLKWILLTNKICNKTKLHKKTDKYPQCERFFCRRRLQ